MAAPGSSRAGRFSAGLILKRLDERERQIGTSRFGLTRGKEPLTLKPVGASMGVTKGQVRQIQCRAMSKLSKAAERRPKRVTRMKNKRMASFSRTRNSLAFPVPRRTIVAWWGEQGFERASASEQFTVVG
jgi:hypothetical protein